MARPLSKRDDFGMRRQKSMRALGPDQPCALDTYAVLNGKERSLSVLAKSQDRPFSRQRISSCFQWKTTGLEADTRSTNVVVTAEANCISSIDLDEELGSRRL